ncbi:AprI/Inh family metalloprotease inhibitor [Martelella soudanensis]|uniref:AprI/Inh family metalloprotease inhibitor n=1 Tax=unclassified Martelella TaxID=2629616 RepID=UPI0015E01CDF|nr:MULTISPECIES: AprI/Inh family metalloprotease inhibitor [unclassified Martelella]
MVHKVLVVAAVTGVLALSACQRTTYDYSPPAPPPPQPLTPAPAGQVQSGSLPPPAGATAYPTGTYGTTQPGATDMTTGQYPAAPGATETAGGMGNVAAPAGAVAVSNAALVGSWKVNEGGVTCDMFLTLTNLGEGLRGGTRGCTGGLSTMKSWGINGDQVVLNDANGYAIARLYKTADTRIEGTSSSGQQVVLSR